MNDIKVVRVLQYIGSLNIGRFTDYDNGII